MNFWIIQAQENPPEPRTDLNRREWRSNTLAETLADKGHHVVRWRSSFSHQAKRQLINGSTCIATDNYQTQYIDSPSYKSHVGFARFISHKAQARNFQKLSIRKQELPHLIHVGNAPIELCVAAVEFGNKVGVPVIIDVRDLWPDIYVDIIPEPIKCLRQPAKVVLDLFSRRLRWAYAHASGFTALTHSYLDWALAKASRSKGDYDTVFPMSNRQTSEEFSDDELTCFRERLGLKSGDIVACYVGNIGYQSEFETLIAAAVKLGSKHKHFKMVIAGSGPRKEALARAAVDSNVVFPGWLTGSDVRALLKISCVGLVAYKSVPNFLKNVPNKYPEYLAGGLAIACGIEGEMGRLTRQHKCGFVYSAQNVDDLYLQMSHLIENPCLLKEMQLNSRKLLSERFNNDSIYPEFARYIEKIVRHSHIERSL